MLSLLRAWNVTANIHELPYKRNSVTGHPQDSFKEKVAQVGLPHGFIRKIHAWFSVNLQD